MKYDAERFRDMAVDGNVMPFHLRLALRSAIDEAERMREIARILASDAMTVAKQNPDIEELCAIRKVQMILATSNPHVTTATDCPEPGNYGMVLVDEPLALLANQAWNKHGAHFRHLNNGIAGITCDEPFESLWYELFHGVRAIVRYDERTQIVHLSLRPGTATKAKGVADYAGLWNLTSIISGGNAEADCSAESVYFAGNREDAIRAACVLAERIDDVSIAP